MLWTQYFSSYKWFSASLQEFECIKVSKIHFPLELKLIKCRSLSEMEESKRKENNIHSKEQHKYSTFFCSTFASHTHIYLYLSSPSMNPPTSPTEAILFSTCFLCALKGSWGGSFCIERLSMNVPFDRYHTTELGRKKKRTSHSFPLSWRYIKCCTRKTVYEKVFFFKHLILWKKSGVYIWPIYIIYVNK